MSITTPNVTVTSTLAHYQSLLSDVASKDAFRLSSQFKRLKKQLQQSPELMEALVKCLADDNVDAADDHVIYQDWKKLTSNIDRSYLQVQERRERIPVISFPEELPISEKRELIAETISKHQVVVLAGETGSGKTTQLPKICLSLGRGVRGMIGHTQPRRIAARTVATRIADELNTPLGESVGYQVRFTDQASENTHIKLMTDGILLAEMQKDRFLSRYDTIIIDEAHERSLNIDFLLGYLKQLLPKRPDLKLIITSATIDVDKFAAHFANARSVNAPTIEVSGRTFPVEVRYRPLLDNSSDNNDANDNDDGVDMYSSMLSAIDEIRAEDTRGDILIFFSGEREIREAALRLRRAQFPHTEVLPLYARLTVAEQNKIFQTHTGQRIVLSTNVAETALTVPGIRYVIDTGLARVSRYSFRTKVQRLPIEPISQASANQRKGRCGRVSEGVCIRLYSEDDFNQRPEFTDAEILRTNLAAVILQMSQLKLGEVGDFPFVDPPDHRLVNDGNKLLQELQAINPAGRLLPLGKKLAALPVDPRLGRMLLSASDKGCLHEVAIIVSALSVQDPRERPANKQQAADQSHRQWWDDSSDFVGYVNLWSIYEEQRQELSGNQLQKWCKNQFLAYMRMREWRDIHTQICMAMKRIGLQHNSEAASYDAIHSSLLSGLLGYIGCLSEEKDTVGEYLGTRNRRFSLFPSSSQFKKKPKWIVAGQLLETSKLYAHNVAKVDPKWILDNAQHLVKRNYSEPHYAAKSGQVMAYEKITLYGVALVEKQRVSYGAIDAIKSREIFIRSALVEGQYADHGQVKQRLTRLTAKDDFFVHQQYVLQSLHDLEAKSRRRDIVVDEERLFEFYDARLPDDIVNLQGFEHWRKQQEKSQPTLLFIDREALMQHDASAITEAQFPDQLSINGFTLPLSYHFEPNHKDDGVSLHVPVHALHLITPEPLQWLVPGLLREKCIALVKALPKQWRKHFVPVPACIDKALGPLLSSKRHTSKGNASSNGQANSAAQPSVKDQPLALALSEQLFRQTGVRIPEALWEAVSLDAYYQMNLCIMDESQQRIDSDRDLSVLRDRYRDHVQEHIQVEGNDFEREGITEWDFDTLPEHYELTQQQMNIRAYPALVDKGHCVDLNLYDNPDDASVDSLRGMVRLVMLHQKETVKYLRKQLFKGKELGLSVVDVGSKEQIIDDIICAAIKQACFTTSNIAPSYSSGYAPSYSIVRDQQDFFAAIEQGRAEIVAVAEKMTALLIESLSLVVAIKKQLKQAKNPLVLAYASSDIQTQLQGLFYSGMMYETPLAWLQQYPKYMKAIQLRLEKVPSQVNKDRANIEAIASLRNRLQDKRSLDGESVYALNTHMQSYRWMLEELRISLFAQTVKTVMPVSVKRLNKQWELC